MSIAPAPAANPPDGATLSWRSWRRPELVVLASALLVALVAFGGTLTGHFLGDDFGYVSRFHEFPFSQWPRLFVESWAGDMWGSPLPELRPITALSFMVDARTWGANPFGFRLTNLLLHAASAGFVGLLAWRVAGRDLACGVVAAVLFGLHPAHAEPVQWITGRVDGLATMFYLAGFLAFVRYRDRGGRGGWAGVSALYALAAFSKEFGLTLPIMFLLADGLWLVRGRRWLEWKTWAPYVGALVVAAVYFCCRRAALSAGGMGAALPAVASAEFQLQFAQRQLTYLGHLFPPAERWLAEGTPAHATRAGATLLWIAVSSVVVAGAWRWAARWRPIEERRGFVFFGVGWYLVATLPLVVTYVSARHLYLASAGVCVAIAQLLRGLLRPRVVYGIAAVAMAWFCAQRLALTMKPWRDAALVSGEIARELARVERDVKPGSALFLDVPEMIDGAPVWTWAVPFALRPPFAPRRLDDGVVVLESRGLYVDWDRWHQQPAVSALPSVGVPSWIVQKRDGKPARRIAVDPARIPAAARRFAAFPLKDEPHGGWRQLIDDLAPPE